MTVRPAERIRDAERSREAILDAAERLFSERGYDGASLGEIAAVAGLSRGTPSYFYGSKEQLYVAVLDRAFQARQAATAEAFEPVRAWAADGGDPDALRGALTDAADHYMRFLARNPSFVGLVLREELDGGTRLRGRTAGSTAVRDAFAALHRDHKRLGLRPFDVDEAVLLFMVLTFGPVSYRNTLMRAVGRNPLRAEGRREQVKLAVDQVLHLLAPPPAPRRSGGPRTR
jgi:TetR/AcrR family transcriptional regulator